MHLVLVDNGRSEQRGREDFRNSLKCIRCGACMNTCPIYRRCGGHSYDYTIPGPIGAILSPGRDLKQYRSLPFASTLCGSCSDVCPVKIDIHTQLYKWRQIIAEEGEAGKSKGLAMKVAGRVFGRPALYRLAGRWMRRSLRWLPRGLIYNRLNVWGKARDLPDPPKESFREWYLKNRNSNG
jgi:L-lactate dehydrogenase complex protein LldF